MTTPSISPISSTTPPDRVEVRRPTTYFIGLPYLVKPLTNIISRSPLCGRVSIAPDPAQSHPVYGADGSIVFGRDWRVTLLDGMQLIPYGLDHCSISLRYKALLPRKNKGFLDGPVPAMGRGSSKELNHAKAISEEHGIPFIQAKSCVEGGNCLLFRAKDGSPRAIVGIFSIALTLLALEEQGYFEEHKEAFEAKKRSFSLIDESFFRKAKNLELVQDFLACDDKIVQAEAANNATAIAAAEHMLEAIFGGEKGLLKDFLEDIEPEGREYYTPAALDLQAKWEMSQEMIASELGVSLDHIAFIPQMGFHIDFHVFTNNAGQVFIHDEQLVQMALETVDVKAPKTARLVDEYKKTSSLQMERGLLWRDKTIKAIESIGCEAVPVPGMYCDEEEKHPVNFMNALFMQEGDDTLLITAASELRSLTRAFVSAVNAKTTVKVALLGAKTMSRILAQTVSGLHCLSWEMKSVSA